MVLGLENWPASECAFAIVALAASIFYGRFACTVFDVKDAEKPRSWKIHQFWLNFLGSAVGWAAAWMLIDQLDADITLSDTALFLLAFLGVTGHAPAALIGLLGPVAGVQKILESLLARIGRQS